MSLRSGGSEHRRKLFQSSALRLTSVCLIVLAVVIIVIGWYRSNMLTWGVQQLLEQAGLLAPKLSGLRFDFKQAELAEIGFDVDTSVGALAVNLQQVNADYDPSTRQVGNVSVKNARLQLAYHPTEKPENEPEHPAVPWVLPLKKLTIENLELTVQTDLGASRYIGQAEVQALDTGSIQAKFQGSGQVIRCELLPGAGSIKTVLENDSKGQIFEFAVEGLNQARQHATLQANMALFVAWLNSSAMLPDGVKAKAAAIGVSGLAESLAGLQLQLAASSADRFNTLQGKATLVDGGKQLLKLDLSMKAPSQTIDIDGRFTIAANELYAFLKPLSKNVAEGLMVSEGEVQGAIKSRWQDHAFSAGSAHLHASGLGLRYGSIQVENGNIRLDVTDLAHWALLWSVDADRLKFGEVIAADKLIIKARSLGKVLTLDQAMLALFGGRIELLPGEMDFDHFPVPLTVRLAGVDLSQLLSGLQYPDISGTGTLSGELPLKLTPDSLELEDGLLNGISPGVFRYLGPTADQENLAFAALRNLAYHTLQAKLNYQPNGDYHLGLRLEGNNPLVLSGHPLVFNLNVGGHLPELLRRGIATGDFERVIMEQVKSAPDKPDNLAKPLDNAPVAGRQSKPHKGNRSKQ